MLTPACIHNVPHVYGPAHLMHANTVYAFVSVMRWLDWHWRNVYFVRLKKRAPGAASLVRHFFAPDELLDGVNMRPLKRGDVIMIFGNALHVKQSNSGRDEPDPVARCAAAMKAREKVPAPRRRRNPEARTQLSIIEFMVPAPAAARGIKRKAP